MPTDGQTWSDGLQPVWKRTGASLPLHSNQFSFMFPVARSGTAERYLCYPVETELRKAAERTRVTANKVPRGERALYSGISDFVNPDRP